MQCRHAGGVGVMKLLALDSARAAVSVAVVSGDHVLARAHRTMARGHAAALIPMAEATLAEASLGHGALGAIAVSVGPGSFTGIRIGLAAAAGYALGLGIPVVGVTTLEAEAAALDPALRAGRNLLVVLDSGRAELYAQAFDPALEPLGAPVAAAPAELAALLPGGLAAAVGDGVGKAAHALTAARPQIILVETGNPADACAVARVAVRRLAHLPAADLPPAVPLYLRGADVTMVPPGPEAASALIRPAGAFDIAILARLHAMSFAAAWPAEAIAKLLASPGTFALIAATSAEPVGFALVRVAADEAEILSLAVAPRHRGLGWGQALLAASLAESAKGGARRLFLEVAIDNSAARRLYAAAHFAEVGHRPGYYQGVDGPIAALVLARDLASFN